MFTGRPHYDGVATRARGRRERTQLLGGHAAAHGRRRGPGGPPPSRRRASVLFLRVLPSDAALLSPARARQAFSLEWLLQHGADGTLQNDDGQTAADYAIRKNRKDLADEIKRHMEAAANGPVIQEAKPDPFAGHEEEID